MRIILMILVAFVNQNVVFYRIEWVQIVPAQKYRPLRRIHCHSDQIVYVSSSTTSFDA